MGRSAGKRLSRAGCPRFLAWLIQTLSGPVELESLACTRRPRGVWAASRKVGLPCTHPGAEVPAPPPWPSNGEQLGPSCPLVRFSARGACFFVSRADASTSRLLFGVGAVNSCTNCSTPVETTFSHTFSAGFLCADQDLSFFTLTCNLRPILLCVLVRISAPEEF